MGNLQSSKTVAEIMKEYDATSTSVWSIRVYGYGVVVLDKPNLTFMECRKLYIAQDNFTSQSVVAYVDSKRIIYVDAQKLFYGGHKELNPCHGFLTRGAGLS
jgi:hypothetical protein